MRQIRCRGALVRGCKAGRVMASQPNALTQRTATSPPPVLIRAAAAPPGGIKINGNWRDKPTNPLHPRRLERPPLDCHKNRRKRSVYMRSVAGATDDAHPYLRGKRGRQPKICVGGKCRQHENRGKTDPKTASVGENVVDDSFHARLPLIRAPNPPHQANRPGTKRIFEYQNTN